ncbi:hypothetical protein NE237_021646 [Protea cynaroides]|uniref:Uncharacterized protein n=1 Tax=Protea cynaroides TaxID=273540 RepID=A0A9Q0HAM1_9MAGN|nr:hypothetical protein NE237_021646 [Protea cynaroides]
MLVLYEFVGLVGRGYPLLGEPPVQEVGSISSIRIRIVLKQQTKSGGPRISIKPAWPLRTKILIPCLSAYEEGKKKEAKRPHLIKPGSRDTYQIYYPPWSREQEKEKRKGAGKAILKTETEVTAHPSNEIQEKQACSTKPQRKNYVVSVFSLARFSVTALVATRERLKKEGPVPAVIRTRFWLSRTLTLVGDKVAPLSKSISVPEENFHSQEDESSRAAISQEKVSIGEERKLTLSKLLRTPLVQLPDRRPPSPMGPICENAAQVVEVLDVNPCMQRSEPPAQPGLVSVEGGDDALLV